MEDGCNWALVKVAAKIASPETKQARRMNEIQRCEDMCGTSIFKFS